MARYTASSNPGTSTSRPSRNTSGSKLDTAAKEAKKRKAREAAAARSNLIEPSASSTAALESRRAETEAANKAAAEKASKIGGKIGGALGSVSGIPLASTALSQFGSWLGGLNAPQTSFVKGDKPGGAAGLQSAGQANYSPSSSFGGSTRENQIGDRGNSSSSTGGNMAISGGQFGGGSGIGGIVDAQTAAMQAAVEGQRNQLGTTMGQLQPWQTAGTEALSSQRALMGLGTPEQQQAAFAAFGESPGQKFLRDRQEKSLMRNSKAMGGLGGGNVRSALQEQSAGFAAQDFNNQFNRLGTLSNQGYNATTAGGQFGAGAEANVSNLLTNQGEARASGILAKEQKDAARTEGIANILGLFSDEIGEGISAIGGGISDFFTED